MDVTVSRDKDTEQGLEALIAGGDLVGKIGWTAGDVHVDVDTGKTQPVATTALLNEFGYINSDGRIVPARPMFRNTIARESSNWLNDIERGAGLVLNNSIKFEQVLETVTAEAANNVRETIKARIAPALAPYTLRKRLGARIKLGMRLSSGTIPLLDTGQMVGSLSNEVTRE